MWERKGEGQVCEHMEINDTNNHMQVRRTNTTAKQLSDGNGGNAPPKAFGHLILNSSNGHQSFSLEGRNFVWLLSICNELCDKRESVMMEGGSGDRRQAIEWWQLVISWG